MKLKIVLMIICTCCSIALSAQQLFSIRGTVLDTTEAGKFQEATVAVLRSRDSVLCKFAYTGKDGSFAVDGLPAGEYIALITCPKYSAYVERFSLGPDSPHYEVGVVKLVLTSKLLQEIIVKGSATAIKIKGDTTEFKANSYVIQPNDKVEDLLRQLPGIEVDKDGKITAQGSTVSKVLVDGEEFFGDDPTLVTKNIRADMVATVQLYDKKSDQAVLTGIDDGKKTKTINIKLKEDKKTGVFGRAEAGTGSSGYRQAQGFINKFHKQEKLSVYGTGANTGKLGLGFMDNTKLGTGNLRIGDDGIIPVPTNGDLDAATGFYDGRGLPSALNGGIHYDKKFDDNKKSFNASYKIGSLDLTGINMNQIIQSLPSGQLKTTGSEAYHNSVFRNRLSGAFEVKPDTSSSLKIVVDGMQKVLKTSSNFITTETKSDTLLNDENRRLSNWGTVDMLNSEVFYTRKFRKSGRTLSWDIIQSYYNQHQDGYLNSQITYFQNGAASSRASVDQYQTHDAGTSILSNNITYSEPIGERVGVLLNYGLGLSNSLSSRRSYNAAAPGNYNLLDSAFSNSYRFNQLTNQAGGNVIIHNNSSRVTFGTQVSSVSFIQEDRYKASIQKRTFRNWAPQLNYEHNFSAYQTLSFNYNGRSVQPTIEELQLLTNNADPLFLITGNPQLGPAFTHNAGATFRGSKPSSSVYFFISPSLSLTSEAIVNNTFTDLSGKTVMSYINLRGAQPTTYDLFLSLGKSLKSKGLGLAIALHLNGDVSYSYINNALNKAETQSYAATFNFSKNRQNKISLYLALSPSYTISRFSLQPQSNNNAAGLNTTTSMLIYLPAQFQLMASANNTFLGRTRVFAEQDITVLNAGISKTFFKNRNLKATLSGNDLLNQNTNLIRSVIANTLRASSYSGIRRYFMLSLSWDFTKFGTNSENK